ncbi:hypothetical protein SAMN04487949_2493 [Halogranum gelatinilyticum]|uniref:Uncharacterized protein n=1 Tax=Halogranum gelatinilyticum TaxID=660521 RepID=A0A1G9VSG7_9EURY|nr:DUF5518 domain-containing protein [Halogranum gelatinilyticum]SDM75212.1 hypothetical protein SAMN04487949_2493 [Halogranum gelatinilyticum]
MALHPLRPLRALRDFLTATYWRFAVVAGGLTAIVVGLDYWQMASGNLDFTLVVLAGFVGGYLFHGRPETPTQVGFRVGLVGSLPVLLQVAEPLGYIVGLNQPAWFTVLQGLMLLGYVLLATTLVGLSGIVGALVGNWLAGKTSGHQESAAGN